MSQKLKIKLLALPSDAKFDKGLSSLILKQAGDFSVALESVENIEAKSFQDVEWCWQLVSKGKKYNYKSNQLITSEAQGNFRSGLNLLKISFPKFLEGGGLCWLEPFQSENVNSNPPVLSDPPTGNPSDGLYVQATGIPKIIAAEWKDSDENKITKPVAYGSTVYLHIYTEALYGQFIEVQLRDAALTNADLTPTPVKKDSDGQVIQSLDPKPLKRFSRKVDVHTFKPESKPQTKPPSGAQTGYMSTHKLNSKTQVLQEANVQKCVFEVFIEQNWQFQGAGFKNLGDKGKQLEINPIVYHEGLKDGMKDVDAPLKVSINVEKDPNVEEKGNNPLMAGEAEKAVSETQNSKDFTFGIFIDGTGNNRYDTIARIDWEKKRLGESKNNYSDADHLKVHAKNSKEVASGENYKYGKISYENDLSNPALLFDSYIDNNKNIFKVYTEGMGTNTLTDDDGNVISYEGNDVPGLMLGQGISGIVQRVTRSIEQMTKKIKIDGKEKIGTLTVDVFGFSRGAAAARHFVDEITYNPHFLKGGTHDHMDRKIDTQYFGQYLPKGGYLSYLLTVKGVKYDKLIIRFAGLFDTVAHYGFIVDDNVNELGLNAISKAKHIVHMTADDEHRANFALTRIIKKENHIELNMPGVHCDVGGSYTEGRPEGIPLNAYNDPSNVHILATDTVSEHGEATALNKFKKTLVQEGWFQDHQITVDSDSRGNAKLFSHRGYLSNQYSFIPLHMMCNFGIEKGLPFDFTKLKDAKNFSKNPIDGHLALMQKLQTKLKEYADKVVANPTATLKYDIEEEDLKKLRNNYLHYNASVGVVNQPSKNRIRRNV